ncbi:unnamed protein product [Symbiodinium natans]|uniref:Uncharacterized protein n=1 Tax=Symbiodinium natans TaxID=878477 RepID=A0A812MC98_9DINO|nr:unnamed protein product [Symbiodinium natans]
MSSPPKQYISTMKNVYTYVQKEWTASGKRILGERGHAAIHLQSVRKSHPALPIFLYALVGVVVASNGALLRIWGGLSPVALWILNCNYSQTRKSGLTSIAEVFASVADQCVRKTFRRLLQNKSVDAKVKTTTVQEDGRHEDTLMQDLAAPAEAQDDRHARLSLWSVAYLGGTIERCKERCSGDFNFVQNNPKAFKDLPGIDASATASAAEAAVASGEGLRGRTWFSTLLLFDEAYEFLMELGILDSPSSAAKKQMSGGVDVSGQTPNAGWANRLLQTGVSTFETKSCGSFGGLHSPSVNTALAGNFHPGVAVEMIRGLRGDHGCQTKARFLFASGQPIQPHEEYESVGLDAKVEYCALPSVLLDLLRLNCLESPEKAAVELKHEDDLIDGVAEFTDAGFFPDAVGWPYTLPDGVVTKLRFRQTPDGPQPEWSMADRDVDVPPELELRPAAQRLTEIFEQEHRVLEFSESGKQLFKSYSCYFNIMVAQAREDGDVGQGAQMGACPWKLAMLALALWDLAWQQSAPPVNPEAPVLIDADVVARAFGLLEILESVVAIMAGKEESSAFSTFNEADSAERKRKRPMADEDQLALALTGQSSNKDQDWQPKAQHTGLPDTKFYRRLLLKAEASSEGGRNLCHQVTKRVQPSEVEGPAHATAFSWGLSRYCQSCSVSSG